MLLLLQRYLKCTMPSETGGGEPRGPEAADEEEEEEDDECASLTTDNGAATAGDASADTAI